MDNTKAQEFENRLIGLFLQLDEYFYLEENGGREADLAMRKRMLKKSVERIKNLAKNDNIIQFPGLKK